MQHDEFTKAIVNGDMAKVQELYDVSVVDGRLVADSGMLVLSFCSFHRQLFIMKWIVAVKGVDVNLCGSLALHNLCVGVLSDNRIDIARFLLESGSNVAGYNVMAHITQLYDAAVLRSPHADVLMKQRKAREEPLLRLYMLWGAHLSPSKYKELRKSDVGQAQWYCRIWDSVQRVLDANAAAVKTTLLVLRFGRSHDGLLLSKDMTTKVARLVHASRRDFDLWDLCQGRHKRIGF